ncbi:hypothetical protein B0F90DRAFT_321226 [Multifurca ochricompacta]|uniref:Uncharacterized protein n=1 Tax=Multifurca ochricompacta TaxID=376703 RepID=A0AAD4QL94_9AGAM|nr:hypothetical protein B0F90DRAFT_321226 [Multifurca ochricompacta]
MDHRCCVGGMPLCLFSFFLSVPYWIRHRPAEQLTTPQVHPYLSPLLGWPGKVGKPENVCCFTWLIPGLDRVYALGRNPDTKPAYSPRLDSLWYISRYVSLHANEGPCYAKIRNKCTTRHTFVNVKGIRGRKSAAHSTPLESEIRHKHHPGGFERARGHRFLLTK